MITIPTVTTNCGVVIPRLGFGVFDTLPNQTRSVVSAALEAGYRHLDVAFPFADEEGVGISIADSGVPRDELFVTAGTWAEAHDRDTTLRAFDDSLTRLGLDYLDLYLAGAPVRPHGVAHAGGARCRRPCPRDRGRGRLAGRAGGADQWQRDRAGGQSAELHPYLQRRDARVANAVRDVVTAAWSPPARVLFDDAVLADIALRHGATIAQVALAWNLDLRHVVLARSITPAHIRSELDALALELDDHEYDAIAALDRESAAPAGA